MGLINNGSNWVFNKIISLDINKAEYKPLRGSSYLPLPKFIFGKGAIIYIKNKVNQCLKWCILRYLNQTNVNAERDLV